MGDGWSSDPPPAPAPYINAAANFELSCNRGLVTRTPGPSVRVSSFAGFEFSALFFSCFFRFSCH